MKKIEFKFKSKDGVTDIRAVKFIPDCKPVGIMQISHGMCEFIDRYDEFSKYMCEKGFIVIGNDHLGHGESVTSYDNWGYFAPKDGYKIVVDDLHTLTTLTKEEYGKDLPCFLLGHSMGSFMARLYGAKYGNELTGLIIMGTGYQPQLVLGFGKTVTTIIAKFKGWKYVSKFVWKLSSSSDNKRWEPSSTHLDWLSRNQDNVNWYIKQPKCTFKFTLNGYYNLFSVLADVHKKSIISNMPKDLPVLFVSGEDDPIGNYGVGVKKVYDLFKSIGMKNVDMKLYKNDRHEILKEDDNLVVMNDIYDFVLKCKGE